MERLYVVGRIPRGIEQDTPIGGDQVDADAAGLGRDEEKASALVFRVVEKVDLFVAFADIRSAVHAKVVHVRHPLVRSIRLQTST